MNTLTNNTGRNLASMLAVACLSLPIAASADDIERTFDVAAGGRLIIDSESGSIEVTAWDENEVYIDVRNGSDHEVEFDHNGSNVTLRAEDNNRGLFGLGRSSLAFNVRVPRSYNLMLNTGGGHIEVSDLTGDVQVDTSGGHIDIGNISGDVDADTSGGHITVGDVQGNVRADTSGGRITIGDTTGDIYADTSGGRIEVGEAGGEVELDTSGGSISAGFSQGPMSADTSGGTITLAGSAVSVNADTSGGNIRIDRSGGPVYADTAGGSITIRQAAGAIRASTSGGRIDAELLTSANGERTNIELDSSGGDVTIRLPSSHGATIDADLRVTRRGRGDYRIYTDFPLTIQDDDGRRIYGRGDINGGGDPIRIETTNSDIHIISVD